MAKKKNAFRSLYGDEVTDSIAKVRIKINGRTQEFMFDDDVSVNYDILQDELIEQSAKYAFWSTILSEQKAIVSTISQAIKTRKSEVIRESIAASRTSGIKVPKYELDEIVESDGKMQGAHKLLIKAEKKLSMLFGVVDSIKTKGDNLRSLAGFKRQEMRDAETN